MVEIRIRKYKDAHLISKTLIGMYYLKTETITGNLRDLFFLADDVIKSVAFFSTTCPFSEALLCTLETLGLAHSRLAFRLEAFFLVCMSTLRGTLDDLANFCGSNQSSKYRSRTRTTILIGCIQE